MLKLQLTVYHSVGNEATTSEWITSVSGGFTISMVLFESQ